MKSMRNSLLKGCFILWQAIGVNVPTLNAQDVWEEQAEQWVADDEEGRVALDSYFEELAEWRTHPLNLNTATKEDLERFPFLSDQLVENILYYLYKYGPMLTLNELAMVEEMDRQTIQYLRPYVCVLPPEEKRDPLSLKKLLKYGRQELVARVDVPLYIRDGYRKHSSEYVQEHPNRQYLGGAWYHQLRYRFRYRDRIEIGLTAEKDAGEPFFTGKNRQGYDFYSPYLFVRNWGRWKAIALGNYRLSYGCGMVMNTDFGMGKGVMLAAMGNRSRGIRKHSSTDEYHYFQGVAASYQLSRRWTLDAFLSYRRMDGTVDNRLITSLKTDGYHRLPREFEKRNRLNNFLTGSHLNYNGKFCELGLTAVYHVFNHPFIPEPRSYNRFYPRGKDFYNVGVDYRFFWKRFQLQGETAVDKQGAVVTLNRLTYAPKGGMQWMVMNRWYDKGYQSLYARSVAEGSRVQNEMGWYLGMETLLGRSWKLTAYGDYFFFPAKRYRVSRPGTSGWEGLWQLNYTPTHTLGMFLRYRYKQKQQDRTGEDEVKRTLPYDQHRVRFQLDDVQGGHWVLKTVTEYVQAGYRGQRVSQGWLLAQSGGYAFAAFPVRLDASVAWFSTDDYASRITLYEKSVLYAFSMPTFYDEGIRTSWNLRCELGRHFILQTKYALTHYFHRTSIGSGPDRIAGPNQSDLSFQIRMKF